jgi:uncharacterized membrane protein HdeD (DUF308 family)
MSGLTTPQPVTEHHNRWKWLLAVGAILVILGGAGAAVASLLEATSFLIFGPLLLVSSLIQLATAIFTEKGTERRLHLLAAGVEAVFGFVVMAIPPQSLGGLVAAVAIFLALGGVARVIRSAATRSRGRAWAMAAGVVALLLGLAVGVGGTVGKLSFVGLCIALDFIFHGVSWSALALMERKSEQETPAQYSA